MKKNKMINIVVVLIFKSIFVIAHDKKINFDNTNWYSDIGLVQPFDTFYVCNDLKVFRETMSKSPCSIYEWKFKHSKLITIRNLAGCGEPPEGGIIYGLYAPIEVKKVFNKNVIFISFDNYTYAYIINSTYCISQNIYTLQLIKVIQKNLGRR